LGKKGGSGERHLVYDALTWLQLDHRSNATPKPPKSGENVWDPAIPHADGDFTVAQSGKSIAADISMNSLPLDVGKMDFDWVQNKADGFFGGLSIRDRQLLYCVYAREMDWDAIAASLECTVRDAKRIYTALMKDLKERAAIWPTK
jgi:hypothetical protein